MTAPEQEQALRLPIQVQLLYSAWMTACGGEEM
jgi:hypothetical protein